MYSLIYGLGLLTFTISFSEIQCIIKRLGTSEKIAPDFSGKLFLIIGFVDPWYKAAIADITPYRVQVAIKSNR